MVEKPSIEYKHLAEMLVVMQRYTVEDRAAIRAALREIKDRIPNHLIAGPAFCIFWFVTSIVDGYDVEIGYPISEPFQSGTMKARNYPALEVLSLVHEGSIEELPERYGQLYNFATEHALISDEFRREVYLKGDNPEGKKIELQFVIHNWNDLLALNLARVLGDQAVEIVMRSSGDLGIDSSIEDRFDWTKGAIERLDVLASTEQKYDILSRCAHVFPQAQIDKLRTIYEKTFAEENDSLSAVDAVIDFMGSDPGWGERPRREGNTIYSTKQPRDPVGYANAKSQLEKRKAYCFCPLVRDKMDEGMLLDFCYCGSGWYRQQWEGATGKAVTIDIIKSVLRGDDKCEFAIHLADDYA
jgi:effector-binding domain-containing protein